MFFGPIRKPKWLPWPLICCYLFCLLCNCWTQFYETWQGARLRHFWLFLCIRWTDLNQPYRCFLPSFVFFQPIWRPRWLPWPLIGWDFFSTSLQPLNEWNLTGRKISTFSNKFVFLGPFIKQRCLPWPQIGRDICSTSLLQLLNRIPTKLWRRGGGGGLQNKQEHQIVLTKYEAVHPTAVSENYSVCIPFIICWYSGARMWLFCFLAIVAHLLQICNLFSEGAFPLVYASHIPIIFSWALDCLKQINVT